MRIRRTWDVIRAYPSGVLLVVQLLGIVVYPFFDGHEEGGVGPVLLALFGLAVLVIAVGVSVRTPVMTWLAVLVALPTAVLTVWDGLTGFQQPLHLVSDVFHALFYLYTFVGLIIYMFSDELVTVDELLAVGATFTVAVWMFAYVYSIVQTVLPGSFLAAVDPEGPRTWMELLFLSTTTMTSTGLSDIVPVTAFARSMVMLQQIAGMLYLAMVVARIVALTVNRSHERESKERRTSRAVARRRRDVSANRGRGPRP